MNNLLFPISTNRVRVYIWRCSVILESVKHTHSHAHKDPLLISQSHSTGPVAEQFPVWRDVVWPVSSRVRRCRDTCSTPVSPLPPSTLLCTHSLFLQWLSPSSDETTMAGSLHILYLWEEAHVFLSHHHLTAMQWRSHTCRQFNEQSIQLPTYTIIGSTVHSFCEVIVMVNKFNSKASIENKWAWYVQCNNLDLSWQRRNL